VFKSETDTDVIPHLPEGEGAAGLLVALPLDEDVYGGVERIQMLACGTSRLNPSRFSLLGVVSHQVRQRSRSASRC